jgi:hypothetical protein
MSPSSPAPARLTDFTGCHRRARRPCGTTGTGAVRLHFRPVGLSAAFFDLDKTVIAKSSALAFGRPFYRDGLISRRDVVKTAYAQLMFRLGGGTDEQSMARTRDYMAALCRSSRSSRKPSGL